MTTNPFNDGWAFRRKVSSFSELGGAGTSEWLPVVLPHDAMITELRHEDAANGASSGHFPGGAYQYRRTLNVPADQEGKLLWLQFEGVYRNASVYVNGVLAGQRASGYAEFSVRIDPYLEFGADNEILVECRAGKDARWYSGAGIYRNVHLTTKDALHIANVHTTTISVESDQAVIEVETLVRNHSTITARTRLTTEIRQSTTADIAASSAEPVTVLPGEQATVRQRFYLTDPQLWSVENPSLYSATVLLSRGFADGLDEEEITFGIRTLQVDPRHGLRVNGETVKLRGACIHHDNGVLGAATLPEAERRRVRILKEAGFNAIRSAHNPMSRAMLDACDELGMYVMDEAFDMWTISKTDEDYSYDFPTWWERDIESMVAKNITHPSVIFYSIGNEIPENGTPFGAVQSRKLAEKIRSLDPNRLITNGINGFVAILDEVLEGMKAQVGEAETGGGVNTMMAQLGVMMNQIAVSEAVTTRTEESQAVLDVAGMNYAESRYELDRGLFPDRIIVGTESFPTRIDEIWTLVEANPHIIGDFTWTGWDYLGEAGIGGVDYVDPEAAAEPSIARAYPWLLAYCGDIDITGHRRPASYYREIVFGLRTDPYIAVQRPEHHGKTIALATPWAWTDSISSWSWPGYENRPVHVEVYAPGDEVALFLDGEELDRQPVGKERALQADFEVEYRPGVLEAVAYSGGVESGRYRLTSASAAATTVVTVDREPGAPLVFLELTLVDDEGNSVTSGDRLLSVGIDGPAILKGLGSAKPVTHETYTAPQHTTFDGRAIAVVSAEGPGDITVTVTGQGLRPTVTVIEDSLTLRGSQPPTVPSLRFC